jgi:hypothetical protein
MTSKRDERGGEERAHCEMLSKISWASSFSRPRVVVPQLRETERGSQGPTHGSDDAPVEWGRSPHDPVSTDETKRVCVREGRDLVSFVTKLLVKGEELFDETSVEFDVWLLWINKVIWFLKAPPEETMRGGSRRGGAHPYLNMR